MATEQIVSYTYKNEVRLEQEISADRPQAATLVLYETKTVVDVDLESGTRSESRSTSVILNERIEI